jgi:hypothetical protein
VVCDSVYSGRNIQTFQSNVLLPSSYTLKLETETPSRKSVNYCQSTRCHTVGDTVLRSCTEPRVIYFQIQKESSRVKVLVCVRSYPYTSIVTTTTTTTTTNYNNNTCDLSELYHGSIVFNSNRLVHPLLFLFSITWIIWRLVIIIMLRDFWKATEKGR